MYRVTAEMDILTGFAACSGPGLVLGRSLDAVVDPSAVRLALASRLAEWEVGREPVRVVALAVRRRSDVAWAEAALPWLEDHGRRALVRTRVPLSAALVGEVGRVGATVMLEAAHSVAAIDRALLGREAATLHDLLAHAQHLRTEGIEAALELAPLVPVVHERVHDIEVMVRHVVAADLRDAHLSVGKMSAARLAALGEVLDRAEHAAIARAYGMEVDGGEGQATAKLPAWSAAALYHAVRRIAEGEGLRVDRCGCAAQCHLDPETTPALVRLETRDLFASTG
jgi:hypothetical protein